MIRVHTLYDNKKTTDITPYCTSVQISGDVQQCARKLDVTIAYPIFDKNHTRTQVGPGTIVWVVDDDEGEIFRGMVFNRELSSSQQVTFSAYDFLIYLLKSKATYNFENASPGYIIDTLCGEVGLQKGSLPSVSTKINRIFQGESLYDIIMTVFTEISKQNGKKYIPTINNKTLDIIEKGELIADFFLDSKKNVISTSYSDTLDNMVNIVKIYDDKGNPIGKAENADWKKKFGVLQEVYTKEDDKDPSTVAKNMLHGVDQQVSIEILGNLKCKTGYGVTTHISYVDVLDNKNWYIDTDTHSWDMSSGKYSTQLTLYADNTMDERGD